jgi:hypothetical protein
VPPLSVCIFVTIQHDLNRTLKTKKHFYRDNGDAGDKAIKTYSQQALVLPTDSCFSNRLLFLMLSLASPSSLLIKRFCSVLKHLPLKKRITTDKDR